MIGRQHAEYGFGIAPLDPSGAGGYGGGCVATHGFAQNTNRTPLPQQVPNGRNQRLVGHNQNAFGRNNAG